MSLNPNPIEPIKNLESACCMFLGLLGYYTKSPIINKLEPMPVNRVETAIVNFLGVATHYVRHPDRYLHRYSYCLKCGTYHKMHDPATYRPDFFVAYCYHCELLEGRLSKGRGHRNFISCYNPMVAVYDALPLHYRQTIDKLIKHYYYYEQVLSRLS